MPFGKRQDRFGSLLKYFSKFLPETNMTQGARSASGNDIGSATRLFEID